MAGSHSVSACIEGQTKCAMHLACNWAPWKPASRASRAPRTNWAVTRSISQIVIARGTWNAMLSTSCPTQLGGDVDTLTALGPSGGSQGHRPAQRTDCRPVWTSCRIPTLACRDMLFASPVHGARAAGDRSAGRRRSPGVPLYLGSTMTLPSCRPRRDVSVQIEDCSTADDAHRK